MEHSFNIDIAIKYGVNSAILLNNIYFWIEKNKANETNFYDGHYWTYNSKKAFSELFPYLTSRQVDYALEKLIDDGVLLTGNYNKNPYDRTLWYAITKKGYSILQNCEMKTTNLLNENDKIVEPIPDINTNIKKDIKTILGATNVTPTLNEQNEPIFKDSKNATAVLETPPLPPQTPPSPNLLDKVEKKPRKRKTKKEKVEEWINRNMNAIDVYGFSDQIKEKLEKYFNYLSNFGTLIPWESLEMQLNELATVSRSKQCEIIDTTIARGWKSLVYVIEQNKKSEQNLPSYRIQGGENHRSKEERQAWFDKYKDVKVEE